jgi:phosphoribosyl 1,2-cyclic phosphodiesterase
MSPQKLEALIVSHCHPDHYGDAETFIEAMTSGTTKNHGIFAASESVLYGYQEIGPCISKYHLNLPKKVITLKPSKKFTVGSINFIAQEARHSDPAAVGLRFEVQEIGTVGYTGDTAYFPELSTHYKDCRLLIMCVIWPRNNPIKQHLNTDDALQLLKSARPKTAIITHFGMRILRANPQKEADYLQTESNTPVIAAQDGMKIILDDIITIKGPRKKDKKIEIHA